LISLPDGRQVEMLTSLPAVRQVNKVLDLFAPVDNAICPIAEIYGLEVLLPQ